MRYRIYTQEEKVWQWVMKKPGAYKWFAWYPVRIKGYNYWLTFVWRYRVSSYCKGDIKDYVYETEPESRKEWTKSYYVQESKT